MLGFYYFALHALVNIKMCFPQTLAQPEELDSDVPVLRVINGHPAKLGQIPYQISFKMLTSRYAKLYTSFCGGVIVKPYKVITAAHCFENIGSDCANMWTPGPIKAKGIKLYRTYAVAGILRSTSSPSGDSLENGQWRKLKSVVYPKRYNFPRSDIAVGVVSSAFVFNQNVNSIPVAVKHVNYVGKCLVSGFGRTSDRTHSPILLFAELDLYPLHICHRRYGRDMTKFICTSDSITDVGKPEIVRVALRNYVGEASKVGDVPFHVLMFKVYDGWKTINGSYCAGSIITISRVLSSAKGFVTNSKRTYHYKDIWMGAGILSTTATNPLTDSGSAQWRTIDHVYSQRFLRYPRYNLAVLETNKPWVFSASVNKIPYATKNPEFDGVCEVISVKATQSWSSIKYVFRENVDFVLKNDCEQILLASCVMFYCTQNRDWSRVNHEIQGGALICHGTGDPAEDEKQGLLVGVIALLNEGLPTMHSRVGMFNEWVTAGGSLVEVNKFLLFLVFLVVSLKI